MKPILKFRAVVQLFRPELAFAAGVCVVAGEIIARQFGADRARIIQVMARSGDLPPQHEALIGFACGFFVSASALIMNDYFDREVDRVNVPERPLPSGAVTPGEVILLAAVTVFFGLAAALALGPLAAVVAIVFSAVGLLYNWRFKSTGLPGNLMVASCVAATFVLGGIAAGAPLNPPVWFFALTAFLIDLGEEIAGDAMDMQGDSWRDSKSLAIRMGRDFALRISALTLGLVVLISPIPLLLGWTERGYVVLLVVADVVVLFFTNRLLHSRTPDEGRRAMRGIYLGPLLGMLVFVAARFLA